MLALRLPPDIESRLDKLARLTGRSKSYHAREAILEHLDDLEDIYLAERRFADLRAGRSAAVPLRRMMKMHGIRD
jgi:RHH-type rel operon transcriptional repressor/antitoxin RelB